MRKFRFTAILLLFIAAAAGSFTIPRRDLRATAQVAGLALDAKAGMLQATFELYSPESDETIGTRKEVVVTEGATLEECIDNARLVYGKTLFASDAAALIIGKNSRELLLSAVLDYYRLLAHDQMDLPVFFAEGTAGAVLQGEGPVVSTQLAQSGKALNRVQTIRDLMNGTGEQVRITGEGRYEILS